MRKAMLRVLLLLILLVSISPTAAVGEVDEDLTYDVELFPGTAYDPEIPTPRSLLGFRPGDRAALPAEIERCLAAWDEASPRTMWVEYARSHEERALGYMIVTSPDNLARIDAIRQGAASLADPRDLPDSKTEGLLAEQPVIAWMAYSIHGDETSGSDASLAVLYHLIAGTSPEVTELLEQVVVLVDPMQNPDGRHRFLQQVAEHRAKSSNVDDQSLLHSGYWPWGRTNHYLFDLNRDWALLVNPETRGRVREIGSWHPQLVVDAHEMGSQDTYLFSPAREPRNPHLPRRLDAWSELMSRDQAKAFDSRGWVYYMGEWNEGWYPGYTDAWGALRGAIGILYEQAGFVEDGVRQRHGGVVTYREAVHHQAVSSLANLATLARHREAILRDFLAERRAAVAASGPYAERTFAILPTANRSRLRAFLELVELQGFEVYVTGSEIAAGPAADQLGRREERTSLPAGTFLIPNRQPEAHLVAALLAFDDRMPKEYLERERRSLLRLGESTIYDTTAWNLTMLHGLEALTLESGLPDGVRRFELGSWPAPPATPPEGPAVAWIVDGADDGSVALAARLLEAGVRVRLSERATVFGEASFARGSVVVLPADNRGYGEDLASAIGRVAGELALAPVAVATGYGDGELPDLGGGHFQLLQPPRIALLARDPVLAYDFGSIWHTLDHRLGIRHSHLAADGVRGADLRRYNAIVLPDGGWGGLGERARSSLVTWVEQGGTLIAIGRSAAGIATEDSGLSAVRRFRDVLSELDAYELAVLREHLADARDLPDPDEVWSHLAVTGTPPWSGLGELERPGVEELERRDAWDRLFMPQGAFVAARVDGESWLTAGLPDELPILVGGGIALMARQPVAAPVRLGVLEPRPEAPLRRVGWAAVPAGSDLRLRASGLLWPEAAGRLANTAAVTRERRGLGQVILFANPPTFRAATHGSARLLLNALVYGPGCGASTPIVP